MISLEAQRSDWTCKPHATSSLDRSEFVNLSPRQNLLKYRISTNRLLSSFENPEGGPVSARASPRPAQDKWSGNTNEPNKRKRPARHVPIVISQNVIGSVLKELPGSFSSPNCDWETSLSTQNQIPIVEPDSPLSFALRPRHIPIVIPNFAHPDGEFPSLPSRRSYPRKATPTTPYSCKLLFTTMSRPTTSGSSRTNTLDSNAFTTSPTHMHTRQFKPDSSNYYTDMSSSQTSLSQGIHDGQENPESTSRPFRVGEGATYSGAPSPATGHQPPSSNGTTNLSGLVCNVHRSTGKEPHALVGATTTILGDKLYVFGGRVLSRRRPPLTSDLYELDLVRRHWTKVETLGDKPPPRYFHSVCALGDTKLICYGGMSPASSAPPQPPGHMGHRQAGATDLQPEVVVLSDIHIYDALSRTWMYIPTSNTPQGRYAHCAAILPSTATFTSANAPLSAIHHNPASVNPNQGTIGVDLDGSGGAEMIIIGGQDSANHYIEQVSVFNLRSLKWTATHSLGRSCGAYRSVVAPLTTLPASRIGKGSEQEDDRAEPNGTSGNSHEASSMLIYSNYNFLDVKLELQVRLSDGSMAEKPMNSQFSPPGLRFPNGGVVDNHFVVSGTYLTASKQEYALWALDLRTLNWSRIDAGGSVFSQGSWNRGILWSRRNVFVILGNRKRKLQDDYNLRRINFSNICMVELEAFGLYDNPRLVWPISSCPSASAPVLPHSLAPRSAPGSGIRPSSNAAIELGQLAMNFRELTDMDLVALGGERVPVNSHLLARRWGPYFVQLLRESALTTPNHHFQNDSSSSRSDSNTLRPSAPANQSLTSRNSSITITPGATANSSAGISAPPVSSSSPNTPNAVPLDPPTTLTLPPTSRSRAVYLPHTVLTLRALVYYFYTSSLPPQNHALCSPQTLCSLLQVARPYRIDGLLEAVVERLHQVLDGRNTVAIFNAAAMAAGGGRGIGALFGRGRENLCLDEVEEVEGTVGAIIVNGEGTQALCIDDGGESDSEDDDTQSERSGSTRSSIADSDYLSADGTQGGEEMWAGGISCVVGLQKRGLRGLMEGRRMRERGKGGANEVGLGIA